MIPVRDLFREALQTGLRLVPWPTEAGLRSVGTPGSSSPVIVTCNYDLTVRRVMRALRGHDAWVVVAPSSGVNVWCAASGGLLTTHQIVTALKTSGIEERVSHHRAILPQLAATGVIGREVSRRCGWKVRFGPVYAEDLPRYLEAKEKKSPDMRTVRFGLTERLEMSAAWAVPTAFLLGAGAWILRPAWALPLVALAVLLAVAMFLLYDRVPGPKRILFAGSAMIVAAAGAALAGGETSAVIGGGVAGILISGLLTFDYSGSTPIEGGSHFEERRFRITLDPDRCEGVNTCVEVCPEGVYRERPDSKKIDLAHEELCVRCGACVVQCPEDALFFQDDAGGRIPPDTIRRFKLNLMGKRAVEAGG
jgi:NAD-dependent dihydropyrimidine dehydrogenase PreA subunit